MQPTDAFLARTLKPDACLTEFVEMHLSDELFTENYSGEYMLYCILLHYCVFRVSCVDVGSRALAPVLSARTDDVTLRAKYAAGGGDALPTFFVTLFSRFFFFFVDVSLLYRMYNTIPWVRAEYYCAPTFNFPPCFRKFCAMGCLPCEGPTAP